MEKYNLDKFLIDSKNIHGEKYDYSKIEWKNKTTKIIIICKEHGEFKQRPSNHLMGKGCSYCNGVGRITKTIFLERAKLIHGDLYEYEINDKEYIKNTEKIGIICKEHGKFYQIPKNHLKEQKCPKCSKFYKYNEMEFIEKCKKIQGEKYEYNDIKKYLIYLGVGPEELERLRSSDVRDYVKDVSRYVLKGNETLRIVFYNPEDW
jgi:ribosomal protein L36